MMIMRMTVVINITMIIVAKTPNAHSHDTDGNRTCNSHSSYNINDQNYSNITNKNKDRVLLQLCFALDQRPCSSCSIAQPSSGESAEASQQFRGTPTQTVIRMAFPDSGCTTQPQSPCAGKK